jgi:cytochrome b561
MTDSHFRTRYASPLIGLHWLTFHLIAVVYAAAKTSDAFPRGSTGRANLRDVHEMSGLLVLGLVWLRLAVRAFTGAPAIKPVPSPCRATR